MRISRRLSLAALAAGATWPGTMGQATAQQPAPAGDEEEGPKADIRLIVLDVGGTLIQDHGEVPEAMLGAFARHGITVSPAEFSEWRGASKRGMAQHFVELRGSGRPALAEAIYADFVAHASKAYENVQPIAGAEDALKQMRAAGYLLATTTGFDRRLGDQVFAHLGWHDYFVASITSDDVTDGRPAPYMLFRAMEAARIDNVDHVMAVGDTPLDLQAGENAGLGAVIGVSSGAASEDRLRQERSTGLLPSVAALPALLKVGLQLTYRRCR